MDSSNQERRREPRARVSLSTYVVRRGGQEPVEMVDASYRGLFLRMEHPPQERELIRLRIKLPLRELPLDVHAVVVRLVEDPFGRRGVGLRFFALNGLDRTDWE